MKKKTLTELITEARQTHDINTVLGLPERKKLIVCPLPGHVHHNNTPSFSIFWRRGLQWWRCHGSCDMEGDVVDLIGMLRVPGYDKRDPAKIREALNLLDERYQIEHVIPEKEVELAGDEMKRFPLGPEVIEYAATRGLTEATLKKFKVGQNGHYMAMPSYEEGILRGIKMRNIWASDKHQRFWQLEGSRMALFNYDAVQLMDTLTYIVKGEIPCMLMDQIGFPQTCAPTGGEGNFLERWHTALALSARLVIGDNDEVGKTLGLKRSELFNAELRFPPERFKDLDEWILADPKHADRLLRGWRREILELWFW